MKNIIEYIDDQVKFNFSSIRILQICVFFIFIGRGYQFIFWDAPLRSILWYQDLMEPLVLVFFQSWNEYATSIKVDKLIQLFIQINGYFFLGIALFSLFKSFLLKKWFRVLLYYGFISMILLSFLNMIDKFYVIFQFFENSIQFITPWLLWSVFSNKGKARDSHYMLRTIKIITAFTFFSHGMYALGVYPVPGYFIDMTIMILHCSESTARSFLFIAGILDIIVAIGVFIPKINKWIFIYAFLWGIATAIARIWANFTIQLPYFSLHQYLHMVIYRIPHGLIPLLGYLLIRRLTSEKLFESK